MADSIKNNNTRVAGRSTSPIGSDDYTFLPNAKHREISGQIFLANDDHTFIPPTRDVIHSMIHQQESGDFPTVTEISGPVKFRHSPAPGGMVPIKGKPKR
jgi:hypothetical protein